MPRYDDPDLDDPAGDPTAGTMEDMQPTKPSAKPAQATVPVAPPAPTVPLATVPQQTTTPTVPTTGTWHDQALLAALSAVIVAELPGFSDPVRAARLARAYADALESVRIR
jgi:hypothetical protein